MNNYQNAEREIDLIDMLYRVAKNWRRIVVFAIIVAFLAAAYKIYTGVRVMTDDEALTKAQVQYEISLNDYNATGERIQANIENLKDKSSKQQEYNEKSELMKIDPMNKWNGSFQFYIDSGYHVNPNLTYQDVDLTGRIVSAYSSYLQSGELYSELLEEIDTVDEIRFLTEIYSAAPDSGAATITVSCVGKSEEDVRALLDAVKQKIAERYKTIRSAIGSHSYEIISESVYSSIDLELDETQKANLLAVSDYANAIGEENAKLTEWEHTAEPQPEYGTWYTTKKSIKFFIIGGIVGALLLCVWYAMRYALTDTVKTESDWRFFSLPILGHIERDEKKKVFRAIDRLVDRIFARKRSLSMDDSCAIAANNIAAMLKEQGVGEGKLVGHLDRELAENIAKKMKTAAAESSFSFAGDVLAEQDTAKNLAGSDKVILIAENLASYTKDIRQTLTLLEAWGKKVLGVVIVE
jgi:capsular polysaccharide biosynthesis protein